MIRKDAAALAALFIASTTLLTQTGQAQSGHDSQSTSVASSASQEATKMVPATAVFISNVDSQKLTAGTPIKVKLQNSVHLVNGPVLPKGSVLVGQVVDDTTETGKAKLALRFTEADLKGGQTVPIKATVFNLFPAPSETDSSDYADTLGWDKQALGVNQANVVPGIDLHSNIESPNSGVLVSNKKDDIKLSANLGIALAIAPRTSDSGQTANGY